MKDFAAPAFDVTKRDAIRRNLADIRRNNSGGQFFQNLPDDAERLKKFFATHDHSMLHVAFGENRHGELHLIVKVIRKIAAQVVVETRRAPGDANDAQVVRDLGFKHARRLKPVACAGIAANEFDKFLEFFLKFVHELFQRAKLIGVEIKSHAADARHSSQQAVAGELFVHA